MADTAMAHTLQSVQHRKILAVEPPACELIGVAPPLLRAVE